MLCVGLWGIRTPVPKYNLSSTKDRNARLQRYQVPGLLTTHQAGANKSRRRVNTTGGVADLKPTAYNIPLDSHDFCATPCKSVSLATSVKPCWKVITTPEFLIQVRLNRASLGNNARAHGWVLLSSCPIQAPLCTTGCLSIAQRCRPPATQPRTPTLAWQCGLH